VALLLLISQIDGTEIDFGNFRKIILGKMRVDHSCLDVLVAQEFLDFLKSSALAGFEAGEGMSQVVEAQVSKTSIYEGLLDITADGIGVRVFRENLLTFLLHAGNQDGSKHGVYWEPFLFAALESDPVSSGFEINIAFGEAKKFRSAPPGGKIGHNNPAKVQVLDAGDECGNLLSAQECRILAPSREFFGASEGVPVNVFPFNGFFETRPGMPDIVIYTGNGKDLLAFPAGCDHQIEVLYRDSVKCCRFADVIGEFVQGKAVSPKR